MGTQLQDGSRRGAHPGPLRRQEGSRRQELRRRQQSTPRHTQKHRFPHLLVAGLAKNLGKVKRSLSKKKFIKRTSVKPFVKYVNQNHVMPTRFLVTEFDLKQIKDDHFKTAEARKNLKKEIRETFSNSLRNLPNPKDNEKAGHTKFFFTRLRF